LLVVVEAQLLEVVEPVDTEIQMEAKQADQTPLQNLHFQPQ
jgi:hypothetical protein